MTVVFLKFSDEAKTRSWQHYPRFALRVSRVFLEAYGPHTGLFGALTKLRTGP